MKRRRRGRHGGSRAGLVELLEWVVEVVVVVGRRRGCTKRGRGAPASSPASSPAPSLRMNGVGFPDRNKTATQSTCSSLSTAGLSSPHPPSCHRHRCRRSCCCCCSGCPTAGLQCEAAGPRRPQCGEGAAERSENLRLRGPQPHRILALAHLCEGNVWRGRARGMGEEDG